VLSWSAATGATSYEIYRNGSLYLSGLSSSTTSFTNTGSNVSGGTTYTYFVRARNSTGTRDSGTVSATTSNSCGAAIPGAFTLQSATAGCSGSGPQVVLSWSVATGVTSYEIYRNGSLYQSGLSSSTTSFANTGSNVSGGTTYTYFVRARNSMGTRDSGTVSATTSSSCGAAIPGAFTLQSATAGCSGSDPQVALSWSAATGATSYEIYRNGSLYLSGLSSSTTSFTNTGSNVSGGTTYTYFVRARNGTGTRDSGTVSATTSSSCGAAIPGAFTLQSATAGCSGSDSQVVLTWSAATGATSYEIYRNGTVYVSGLSSSTTSFTNTGSNVSGGTTYTYFVRARNSMGTRDSGTVSATTSSSCGGTFPAAFTLQSAAAGCSGSSPQVVLTWTPSSGATTYEIHRNGSLYLSGVASNTTAFTNTGSNVAGATTYTYFVRARNGAGTRDSGTLTATTSSSCGGGVPGAFSLQSATAGCSGSSPQITLIWTPSPSVTTYEVYRNGSLYSPGVPGGTLTFVNSGSNVTSGTTYTFLILARNAAGTTNSGSLSATAPSKCGGTPPGAFTLTSATPSCIGTNPQVALAWTASIGATSYDVYRNGTLYSPGVPAGTLTFVNKGSLVTPGASYSYVVKARTSSGDLPSNAVAAVVPSSCDSAQVLSILTTILAAGLVTAGYAEGLSATGGLAPYTWSVSTGMPTGLSLNATVGSIFGTPTLIGNFTFTVTVRDNSSPQQTASKALAIAIAGARALSIATTSLPAGTVGTSYGQSLEASGGQAPYTWSASSGLPAGLAVPGGVGVIRGTPTTAGTASSTITVRDSSTPQQTVTKTFSILVTDPSIPADPTGLVVTRVGGAVRLAWTDTSTNETGFKIERRIDPGGTFEQIAETGQNGNSFADASVIATAGYCYRVKASNLKGSSTPTNVACVPGVGDSTGQQLQFSSAAYRVPGSPSNWAVTVTRTGGSAGTISATLLVSGGTASQGVDYTVLTNGTVSFEPGETSKQVTAVRVLVSEPLNNLTIKLKLTQPSSGVVLAEPSAATLTIEATEAAPPGDIEMLDTVCWNSGLPFHQPCQGSFLNSAGYPKAADLEKMNVLRKGVVTDGVTLLLLKVRSATPVTVSLKMVTSGAEASNAFGTLSWRDGTRVGQSITVEPESSAAGATAYALFQAPVDFPALDVVQVVATNGTGTVTKFIRFSRPPVVFVHGVWSGFPAFADLEAYLEDRGFVVARANYGDEPPDGDPAGSFDPNGRSLPIIEVANTTAVALLRARQNGFAASQVDVVAHSMGGLVSRARATGIVSAPNRARGLQPYAAPWNRGQGEFHKLVTIGTPHRGTAIATFLLQHRCEPAGTVVNAGTSSNGMSLETFFHTLGTPLGDALYQFQPSSPVLRTLDSARVPTHTIAGLTPAKRTAPEIAFDLLIRGNGRDSSVERLIGTGGDRAHDTLVPWASQLASRAPSNVGPRVVSTMPYTIHAGLPWIAETSNPLMFPLVEGLLRAPLEGWFAAIQPYDQSQLAPPIVRSVCAPLPNRRDITGAVIALTPDTGTVVRPGEEVQITFTVPDDGIPGQALISVQGQTSLVDGSGGVFSLTYTIPEGVAGQLKIAAATLKANSDNYATSTSLTVQPSSPPDTLVAAPGVIALTTLGATFQLSVTGGYVDGSEVSLTPAVLGTTYSTESGGNTVVSIGPSGVVEALGVGEETVIVRHGGLVAAVTVTVDVTNQGPTLAALGAVTIRPGSSSDIALVASDPDRDGMHLAGFGLPSFATLVDNNNGSGIIQLRPSLGDVGTYTISIGVTDDGTPALGESQSFQLTVALATVSDAPTGVTGTAGNGAVSLAFLAPLSNGGGGITGYTVTASPGGATASGTGSPIVVTGLTNGTAYTFTVTATNSVGTSAASTASSAVTPATVPGAPTSVAGVAGNGQVTVSFTAPSSTGGAAITGYTVTASPGGASATGTASPLAVTGLTNGTAYAFTVTATNSAGTSAASAASAAVTPATVPGAPTSVTGTRGNTHVVVAFTAPSSNGGSAITGYTVTASPGGATSTGATSPLTVTGLTNGTAYTFTVTATNAVGTGAASTASAPVTPEEPVATLSPASLRFSATKNGSAGAITNVTAAQNVSVTFSSGAPTWTVSANQPWVQLSATGGAGAGTFTASIINPGNVLGASTSVPATITVVAPGTSNTPRTIAVTLTIDLTNGSTVTTPIGQVDTPLQNATGVQGAIGVTGWVLDNIGVTGVKIYRNCLLFENQASCQPVLGHNVVEVGDAAFLAGARTDVESAFTTYPQNNRAGWGYLMLTSMLPQVSTQQPYGGQGPLTLYAVATDVEGNRKLLGRSSDPASAEFAVPTQITMANATIAKPFGAIDTPGQGQTVSGLLNNFGWALTPDSNTTGGEGGDILIPTNGSTMTVFIDSLPVALVAYNQCRGSVGNPVPVGVFCNDDVSNIFGNATPQTVLTTRTANATLFRNLDAGRAAIGAFTIDTATLSNGLHTIAWSVTDSAGRTEGIGSRFFNVLNSGADESMRPAEVRGLALMLDGYVGRPGVEGRLDTGLFGRRGFDQSAPWAPPVGYTGDRKCGVRSAYPALSLHALQTRRGPLSSASDKRVRS